MRFGDSWDAGYLFPPRELVLSREDRRQYETLADRLVAESLQAFEDFIANRRSVDLERWRVVNEKGSMTAYRSRQRRKRRTNRDRVATEEAVEMSGLRRPKLYSTDSSLSELMGRTHTHLSYEDSQDGSSLGGYDDYEESRIGSDAPEQSELDKTRPPNTPMVFGGGVIPGTVEDAGLGFLADSEDLTIMRTATSKDVTTKDMRILAKLRGPTQQDPFRFLGIKWSSHSAGNVVSKPRDALVLESTGMALDSNGERVCYLLVHSIEIEEVPEFRKQGLVRLRSSSCRIVRAYNTQGEIEVYFRGFCNAGGHFSVSAATQLFCDAMLSTAQVVEESYLKKLAWFVHAYTRRQNSHGDEHSSHDGCACCHKLPTKGFKKLLESRTTCFLCRHKVCKKCTVKKALPIDSQTTKSLEFCLNCYLKAKKLSAWRVAVASLAKP